MIFDHETTILARLAAKCAGGSVFKGSFDAVDMSDDSTAPVLCQIVLDQINVTGQTGKHARALLTYSCSVYTDLYRATTPQKTAAGQLLTDAIQALVGWEYSPGVEVEITDGQSTGSDGRLLRLSFGFTIPAHFAGT